MGYRSNNTRATNLENYILQNSRNLFGWKFEGNTPTRCFACIATHVLIFSFIYLDYNTVCQIILSGHFILPFFPIRNHFIYIFTMFIMWINLKAKFFQKFQFQILPIRHIVILRYIINKSAQSAFRYNLWVKLSNRTRCQIARIGKWLFSISFSLLI